MSPRRPYQTLQEQGPHVITHVPRASTPDLLCHEVMPTPEELGVLVAEKPDPVRAEDCWCLDPCTGPHCCRAQTTKHKRKRIYAAYESRGYTYVDDAWPQRVLFWYPGEYDSSSYTLSAAKPFRDTFHELCANLRIDRRHVRFVWHRQRRSGCIETVEIRDDDAPWDLGFREGRTEHVQCEYC
jgi:hypothetical protein